MHEVHEGQAVVGILGGPPVFSERQPAQPPLVVLHELPVGLNALLLRKPERVAAADRLADQVVVVGFGTAGAVSVRPQLRLHLHNTHVDPHLEHLAAGAGLDQAGVHLTRRELPRLEQRVEVAGAGHRESFTGAEYGPWRLGT